MTMRYILQSVIVLFLVMACGKDNLSPKEVIQGKWKGTTRIWKRTATKDGIVLYDISDTTNWTAPGYSVTFDFKQDSLNFYYTEPNYIITIEGANYTINADRLKFYDNPFSYRSTNPRFGSTRFTLPQDQNYSYISELTSSKLVLYDRDTINFDPLIVKQQWNNFAR